MYVRDLVSSIIQPVKRLVAFQKLTLEPGEARELVFQLNRDDFSLVRADETRVVEPGEFLIMLGGSSKGLGAAGISAQAEIDRTKALIAEAKKQGMKIIGLHIGGEGRRGELSDKFLVDTVPACDYVIVVAEGNKDNLFTKLTGGKIPLDSVEKISKVGEPLAKAFK